MGVRYVGIGNLSQLWTTIKAGFATLTHGHNAATVSAAGFMAETDKSKLEGIAAGANNYAHPTGDGSLHVPATGESNNGKYLRAGATAGSLEWYALGNATALAAGLMSPEDKQTIGNLQSGGVSGVKGARESAYRAGNVNLTPENIGAMKLDLLWENPNSTANFAAQTIALALGAYDFVDVLFAITASSARVVDNGLTRKGDAGDFSRVPSGGTNNYGRVYTISDTGISFGSGYSNQTVSDGVAVPRFIYGVKK